MSLVKVSTHKVNYANFFARKRRADFALQKLFTFFLAVLSVFAYTFEYFTSRYIKMSLVLNNWTLVKTLFNSLKVGSWGFECIIILVI